MTWKSANSARVIVPRRQAASPTGQRRTAIIAPYAARAGPDAVGGAVRDSPSPMMTSVRCPANR
ncbi:MAG: hypothetical protein ACYCU5_04870 [Actinomycetes bacterium]